MSLREVKSFCRICLGSCGTKLVVDDEAGRIVDIRGDKSDPLTKGYACIKGLNAGDILRSSERLLHPMRRLPDGRYVQISKEQAIGEIAERLAAILAAHGPNALGAYRGSSVWFDAITHEFTPDWVRSMGSYQYYSSVTIDQSAKMVSAERLGSWAGGSYHMDECDTVLIVGANPLVAVCSPDMASNPTLTFKAAKERGLRLIVVDPRKTETARLADIFLQSVPGEDVTLAAGLLNIVLSEGWQDHDFCARFVSDLDALRRGVARYTPDHVERRAGVPAALLREAAACFAQARRAMVTTSTGPCMATGSNLAQHLYDTLAIVCGHLPRAGHRTMNPCVMNPRTERREQVYPPRRNWTRGPKTRGRGFGSLRGEMMSGALAEEILIPGEGQIRSLFVVGGNPAASIPETNQIVKALSSLDLLVVLDRTMSETARLAHYVLPPTLLYEVSSLPTVASEPYVLPVPYAQYAAAVVPPPEGSEVEHDWYWLWVIADRMGRTITFNGVPIEPGSHPSVDQMLVLRLRNANVPFETIKRHEGGHIYDVPETFVQPGDPANQGRFEVGPADVVAELTQMFDDDPARQERENGFTHRMVTRRTRESYNTMYRDVPELNKRAPNNPAWLHPDDLSKLHLADGDRVRIESEHGSICTVVRPDATLRLGVVSLTWGFGALPGEDAPFETHGAQVNQLLSASAHYQSINAMPRMSAVPVRLIPL